MNLSWTLVSKKLHPREQLQERLRSKLIKLERYLQPFPPGAVFLQVGLARHPRTRQFSVSLTLRLPSKVLRSKKSAAEPIAALDQAVKALEREVSAFKSALRRESEWKRPARRQQLIQSSRFPAGEDAAPEKGETALNAAVRNAIGEQYGQLLYYVRREIWRAEAEGWAPRHGLDAEALADEVACQAFARARSKPAEQTYRLWLYALAREELDRRIRDFEDQESTTVPLDATEQPPASVDGGEDSAEQTLEIAEGPLHGDAVELKDVTPDTHVLPPDAEAADHDLVQYLHTVTQPWPKEERAVFELHFLEGFELDEVAMLEKLQLSAVKELVDRVQLRLREALTDAVQTKASAHAATLGLTNRANRVK